MFHLEIFILDYWKKIQTEIIWRNNWHYIFWRSKKTLLLSFNKHTNSLIRYNLSSCASKVNKAIFFIDFSVPPNVPVIVNEAGREATSQLGPYPEGATTQISCEVRGGELCNLQIYYFVWSYDISGTYFIKCV